MYILLFNCFAQSRARYIVHLTWFRCDIYLFFVHLFAHIFLISPKMLTVFKTRTENVDIFWLHCENSFHYGSYLNLYRKICSNWKLNNFPQPRALLEFKQLCVSKSTRKCYLWPRIRGITESSVGKSYLVLNNIFKWLDLCVEFVLQIYYNVQSNYALFDSFLLLLLLSQFTTNSGRLIV